jgi:hypothetical protein
MPSNSTDALSQVSWQAAFLAASIAVAGELAMTVVLGAVAMLAAAIRGTPSAQIPMLLTADEFFPLFCAAAGVLTALLAGYITTPAANGGWVRHGFVAGTLTVVAHAAAIALCGSPLGPWQTTAYVSLTLPAVCLGCYWASPAPAVVSRPTSCR